MLAGAGVALGLGLATKFSAVFLIPVFVALQVIHSRRVAIRPHLVLAGSERRGSDGCLRAGDPRVGAASAARAGDGQNASGDPAPAGSDNRMGVARRPWKGGLSLAAWATIVPLLVYLPLCLANSIDTGVRHLLPVYPFLFVAAGAAASAMFPKRGWAAAALVALALVMKQRCHPANRSLSRSRLRIAFRAATVRERLGRLFCHEP